MWRVLTHIHKDYKSFLNEFFVFEHNVFFIFIFPLILLLCIVVSLFLYLWQEFSIRIFIVVLWFSIIYVLCFLVLKLWKNCVILDREKKELVIIRWRRGTLKIPFSHLLSPDFQSRILHIRVKNWEGILIDWLKNPKELQKCINTIIYD